MRSSGLISPQGAERNGDPMGYVSKEQIALARQMDLLTYLQTFEPQELVKVAPGTYCTREHDSLKISNGMWHWFSRRIGGKNALDYLLKVKGMPLPDAVEHITSRSPVSFAPPPRREKPQKNLLLPERNGNSDRVIRYLQGRGIHRDVIDHCLELGILYEDARYHNAVFLGMDSGGVPRYASLRGTWGDFKKEASGSDKHYSFRIAEVPEAKTLHLFESAIDLMSYATLRVLNKQDWKQDAMLSLAGVYQTKRENVVPIALSQFLKDHPQVRNLHLHLDNDDVGRGAAEGILGGLGDQYHVFDEPPPYGKDVNEYLLQRVGLCHRKETTER